MNEGHLSAQLMRFAEDSLGHPLRFNEVSWPHRESSVWEVEAECGAKAFLKQHRRRSKFDAELAAYERFVPALGDAAPSILAINYDGDQALLLSSVPGRVVAQHVWAPELEILIHKHAAQLLRRLHSISVDGNVRVEVDERNRTTLEQWLGKATQYFPLDVIDWARSEFMAGVAMHLPICVCHHDFGPRNWLAQPDGQVSLIDFERMRVDYQYLDWSRLWMREWLHKPELREAFLDGYGPIPDDWEKGMHHLMAFYALSGVVWSVEHGDINYEKENRVLLERLHGAPIEMGRTKGAQ